LCTVRNVDEGTFEHPAVKRIGYEVRISTLKSLLLAD